MQGLIDARLIGAERAATLKDEDDLALLLRRVLRARRAFLSGLDVPLLRDVHHLVLPHCTVWRFQNSASILFGHVLLQQPHRLVGALPIQPRRTPL